MAIKCPQCQTDNSETARYCKSCATSLLPSEEIPFSHTKTLQTPARDLIKGTTFAGRYQIIEEIGKGGMEREL